MAKKITLEKTLRPGKNNITIDSSALIVLPIPAEHTLATYFGKKVKPGQDNALGRFLKSQKKKSNTDILLTSKNLREFHANILKLSQKNDLKERTRIAFGKHIFKLNRYFSNQETKRTLNEDLINENPSITVHSSGNYTIGIPLSYSDGNETILTAIPYIEHTGEKSGKLQWKILKDQETQPIDNGPDREDKKGPFIDLGYS